jgi:NADH:ubiquinone oxidoreductase subunit B-like Fe-S oxidoreductase
MIAASMAKFDIARFGSEVFRPSPRQADLLIVSGTVTKKMAPQVIRLWNQMPEPKYCIAMGACAISGGPFKQGYNVLKGIDRFIPPCRYANLISRNVSCGTPRFAYQSRCGSDPSYCGPVSVLPR